MVGINTVAISRDNFFPFSEFAAMISRSGFQRSGGEIGARQKVQKRRNETATKGLKTHDSAKRLIRSHQ
jgi:hypothetical protein